MSTNRTQNYSLCQWEPDDKVLRTDFNEDNRRIDAALASLAASAGGLSSGKADKSALDALSTTVSQHTSTLAKKGNCQLYAASYTGSGASGAGSPNSLTFPKKPVMVIVTVYTQRLMMFQGQARSWSEQYSGSGSDVTITWSGNSVQWYTSNPAGQMNTSGNTYSVLALLQAD